MNREFDEINRSYTPELTRLELATIGKNLRKIRLKHNLTLNDTSFYTFTNQTTLWRLETGRLCNINLATLIKFCQLYHCTLIELLTADED